MSKRPPGWAAPERERRNNTPFKSVALLLQGGGALGAYQAGVYEALAERGVDPTWVAGISIGAINSAIIAGNPPAERVAKLRAFWELVSGGAMEWPSVFSPFSDGGLFRTLANQFAAGTVMVGGAAGFFRPRFLAPLFQPAGSVEAISWYGIEELRGTLERLVDFDRINSRDMRFSVGAVNVASGNFAYFDNETTNIRPEHIMASGALPPAFPPVEIDGEHYWDGGMVSNTPLDWVLSARSNLDMLIFQVDLWSASGEIPRDLQSVAVRMKEIQYSSRTRAATAQFEERQKLRTACHELLQHLPAESRRTPEAVLLAAASDPAVYNIVELIYRSPTYEGESKDYEFSRQTMRDHWRTGYENARDTLAHPEVLARPPAAVGMRVYDFITSAGEQPNPGL